MKKIKQLFFVALVLVWVNACEYNKAEPLGPIGPPVSFDTVIKPVIIQHCVKCHSDTSHNPNGPGYAFFLSGPNHDNFSVLHDYAVMPSPQNSAHTDISERIHGYDGVERMPKDGPPYLPDSIIEKIDRWIRHGAPINN
ncbi:MAG: hypothetical protein JWO58_820 [Chitinophagaceae bacterium]|nr:hypothetical protein [Chitinophagaceae bacterium]